MKKILKRLFCLAIAVVMLMSTAGAEGTSTYMAYRSNAVTISAADGLGIVSGTFVIKDLSITNGQDPDGRNYVGQVHTLENGEFTFSVGRSASESVASWFNSKISGYNDPSVNGDRTTFDQTADDLNFAFVGDLNLVVDTADDPQGLSVTFPDVVIAQGSTLFRNNWWFGQHSGQHTRDSDGPDTVLAIGSTTEGRTVYASFLRGGNEVNEISLEAIHVVEAAADSANKVVDVKNKFAALPIDGVQSNLEGFPGSYDPTVNHIQGYAQYDSCDHTRYSILTHSVGTAPYAHIVAGPKTGSDKWGFKTYLQNWRHPGGVQVMGDYLLVPSEQDASAHIALYDLRSLAVKELRRVETFDLAVSHMDRFQFPAAIVLLTVEEQCGRGHMIGIAKRGLLPLEIPILPVGSAGLPLGEVVADVRRALHPGPVCDGPLGAGCLEPVRVADDPVGHETAIGPAANAQTGGIDVRPAGQGSVQESHDILIVDGPEPALDIGKVISTALASPGVAEQNEVSGSRQDLHLVKEHRAVAQAGPAMDGQNGWVFFAGNVGHRREYPPLDRQRTSGIHLQRLGRGDGAAVIDPVVGVGQTDLPAMLQSVDLSDPVFPKRQVHQPVCRGIQILHTARPGEGAGLAGG